MIKPSDWSSDRVGCDLSKPMMMTLSVILITTAIKILYVIGKISFLVACATVLHNFWSFYAILSIYQAYNSFYMCWNLHCVQEQRLLDQFVNLCAKEFDRILSPKWHAVSSRYHVIFGKIRRKFNRQWNHSTAIENRAN